MWFGDVGYFLGMLGMLGLVLLLKVCLLMYSNFSWIKKRSGFLGRDIRFSDST